MARPAQAPPAITLPVPEPAPGRARLGRGWRLLAGALALTAAGISWGTVSRQRAGETREAAASVQVAQVVSQPSGYQLMVTFPDGASAKVEVADSSQYPVGSRIDLFVDDAGLRQPVSEPFDVTLVLVLAVLAAGAAIACWQRGHRVEAGLRHFLATPQPAQLVRVMQVSGVVAIFPFEAAVDDAPYLLYPELRTAAPAETDDEQPPKIATLYGLDAPGNWCAVEVDGALLTPARPVRGGIGRGQGGAPEPLDAPIEAAALTTLPETDRTVSYDLRVHRRSAVLGVTQSLALGASLCLLATRLLPSMGPVGLTVLCTVILGLALEFGWRTLLRPRLVWSATGIAALTALGGFAARWEDVAQVATGRRDVTVVTEDGHAAIIPARRAGRHNQHSENAPAPRWRWPCGTPGSTRCSATRQPSRTPAAHRPCSPPPWWRSRC